MAKDFKFLAKSIIDKIGGTTNIEALTHCMTRLRFVVIDNTLVQTAELKNINGVMGVVQNDNQCQVIIGNDVSDAFKACSALLESKSASSEPIKRSITLKSIGSAI